MSTVVTVLVVLALVLVSLYLNSLLLTLEDELPGGFENPTGDRPRSPEVARALRAGRRAVVIVAVVVAIVAVLGIASVVSEQPLEGRLLDGGLAGGAAFLAVGMLFRRREFIWAAAAAIIVGMGAALMVR